MYIPFHLPSSKKKSRPCPDGPGCAGSGGNGGSSMRALRTIGAGDSGGSGRSGGSGGCSGGSGVQNPMLGDECDEFCKFNQKCPKRPRIIDSSNT